MTDQTPTSMPTADARAALDALLGHRVRATVVRRAGTGPEVITGVLIHDVMYAARDATIRYPEADVHVDCMNLLSVEEAPADADLRDRIAEAIKPSVFPKGRPGDSVTADHVARWIGEDVMKEVTPALAAAHEEGRRAGIAEVAAHFAEAYDVAATGRDLIVPPEHMKSRSNHWMAYLRWATRHVRGYAEGSTT